MKKIIFISLTVVLIFVWGVRFYLVNREVDLPVVQVFPKGQEVPIANDFFINSDEGMDGYNVTVLDAELVSVDNCYRIANPDMPGTSFSLRQGTDMELILPFSVMSSQTSRNHILDDPPKLQISLYPHQKLIELY